MSPSPPPIPFHRPLVIDVMSREEAIAALGTHHVEPISHGTAVISIADPASPDGTPLPVEFDEGSLISVLHERFADMLPGEEGAMSAAQAAEVVGFVRMLAEGGRCSRLVVHCDGGVSRSAEVAAAIGLLVGNGDSFVFDDPRLCPNMGCYRAVLRAAGADVADAEAEERERRNERIWWAARALDR